MKVEYKKKLTVIVILTIILFSLLISYGLYLIEKKEDDINIATNGCVEVIYSDNQNFNLIKPDSISDSDGPRTKAKTISVANHCKEIKTVTLMLDVKNTSTLESNKIKIYLNGDIGINPTFISDLKEIKNTSSDLVEKRLLYKYDLEPEKTTRLNIRMWLDEYAVTTTEKDSYYTNYYINAENQVIKPNLKEKLLADNENNIKDGKSIDFSDLNIVSGLYNFNNVYYYRGSEVNNYFKLNDKIFRVVGINKDGSVKLAYVNNELMNVYNDYSNKEDNVEFASSRIISYLNEWYKNNMNAVDEYVVSYNYCNDTTYTKYYSQISYGANKRVFDDSTYDLNCTNNDLKYGGIVSNKVGMLSADELLILGFDSKNNNATNYLYNGLDQYTISPYSYYYGAYMIILNKEGKLTYTKLTNKLNVTPIINLKSSLNLMGSGTLEEPYELDLED